MSTSLECYEYVTDALDKMQVADDMLGRALKREPGWRFEPAIAEALDHLNEAWDSAIEAQALLDQQIQDEA